MDAITDSRNMSLCELQDLVMDRVALGAAVHGVTKSYTRLNWTEPTPVILLGKSYGQRRLAGYRLWGFKRVKCY